MGRYIDWADVVGRYAITAKMAGETGTGSYWLEHAEGEVDARLAPYNTVPFTAPAPMVVKDLAIDLTYFKMAIGTDHAKEVWKYLEARFKAIADGTLVITNSAGPLSTDQAWSSNSYHTAFGPDAPEDWRISSQWIDDTRSERGQL